MSRTTERADATGRFSYCDACGRQLADGDHAKCRARRAATDPPRYCRACGRKLAVQVLPLGWRARCVRCGPLVRADAVAAEP